MKKMTFLTACMLLASSHTFAAAHTNKGNSQHSVQVHGESLTFYYNNAQAKQVFFASATDYFSYHPAIKGVGDSWKVTIPLSKEFSYFYIVDGEITIPDCSNTVLDDFGTKNCLYVSVL
jgi:hypothetical protein